MNGTIGRLKSGWNEIAARRLDGSGYWSDLPGAVMTADAAFYLAEMGQLILMHRRDEARGLCIMVVARRPAVWL